jgi:hypothetical protein
MKKLIFATASTVLALGLVAAAPAASAQDRYPLWVDAADSNKDGMVSRDEYLKAMGKLYDDKMAKMKKMSAADQAKMMKDDAMTIEAFRILYREMSGGGN